MRQKELAKAVAREAYIDTESAKNFLGALENVILRAIGSGEDVYLFNGFKLRADRRPAKDKINPATKKPYHIDECWVCHSVSTTVFTDKINGYVGGRKVEDEDVFDLPDDTEYETDILEDEDEDINDL